MAIVTVHMDVPEEFAVDPDALAAAVFARLADEAGYVDLPDEDGAPVAPSRIAVTVTASAGFAEVVHPRPADDAPEPRTYCIGLPVGITVYADGRVTAQVDTSEASDLWEGQPMEEGMVPVYTTEEVDADVAAVTAATTVEVLPNRL
jgi:hypothetical protein